jgi:hypothetical protein
MNFASNIRYSGQWSFTIQPPAKPSGGNCRSTHERNGRAILGVPAPPEPTTIVMILRHTRQIYFSSEYLAAAFAIAHPQRNCG